MAETELQGQLERLLRRETDSISSEGSLVRATGTSPPAWTVQVKALVKFNVYRVQQVSIGPAGVLPIPVGGYEVDAVNLAESFTVSGSVSVGTCAVMWRIGDRYIIWVKP